MDNNEIKRKAQEIEKIYKEYIDKVNELKKEQDKILQEFFYELKKIKIENLKNKINKNNE